MPGQLIGSFAFTGTLIGSDGGPNGEPATTCLLDGGPIVVTSTITFWAYLSQDPAAGVIWWDLYRGTGIIDGGLVGSTFTLAVPSSTPELSGCGLPATGTPPAPTNCVGKILESVQGWQTLPDGTRPDGGFNLPVLQLAGWLDDRLDPDLSRTPVCSADAGYGCGLACDLVYGFTGVPGTPPPQ
jgi:hypothetical protein